MDFIKVIVIPAQAGIQDPDAPALALVPRFRGGDGKFLKMRVMLSDGH